MGERLMERWENRESRLVEILVDSTQTDKQTLKQTGLSANLSERQTYRQVSRQTDRTNMQPRPDEDSQTARHRQDKAARQTNGTGRTDKSEPDKCNMDGRQQVEGGRPTEADISRYHGDLGEEHEWRATTSEKKWLGGPLIPSPLSRLPLSLSLSPSLLCLSPVGCRLEATTASSAESSSGHATSLVVELQTFPSDSKWYWSRLSSQRLRTERMRSNSSPLGAAPLTAG